MLCCEVFCNYVCPNNKQKMQDKELPNWNVRTFLDMANSIRHMGRTALMAHELSHLNVDVSSLSEVRHADDDR